MNYFSLWRFLMKPEPHLLYAEKVRWRGLLILARRNTVFWSLLALGFTLLGNGFQFFGLVLAFAAGGFAEDWHVIHLELRDR